MYMPHAIEVDGHIITMFDPINHDSLEAETEPSGLIAAAPRDRRWVRIRRPVVMVGGELTMEMLDLSFNPLAKFYEAPIPAEGQRRRVSHRRLRASADAAAGSAEPLDRAARKPRGLSHAPHRQEVPGALRRAGRVCDEPQSRIAGRRGVPAPHSLQDRDRGSVDRSVLADLRAELQEAGSALPSGHGRVPAAAPLRPDAAADARLPSARSARTRDRHVPLSRASSR